MNDKTSGRSLYTDTQFDQLRFLKMLFRVLETQLLQEPVFAHCGGEGGMSKNVTDGGPNSPFRCLVGYVCKQFGIPPA